MRTTLLCASAITILAGAAHADELADLKAMSDQLQQQNKMLTQRIDQLERREITLEAQPIPAAPQPSGGRIPIPADDGNLTWHGVTLYGSIDLGAAYESHGAPLSPFYGQGLEYLIAKISNKGQVSVAPNAMSNSDFGLKGTEEVLPGLAVLFNLQSTFNPTSGNLSNGPESLIANNGVPLNKQTTNSDSSRAGQAFNGAAYFGFSSPSYGTLTVGRQNSLVLDAIINYDPTGASNAFSAIGYSGTWGGGGDTEDSRFDTSAKYLVTLGPIRAGALVQFGNSDNFTDRGAYEFDVGTDYQGLSVDGVYSQVYDAISAATIADPTPAEAQELAGTISDNTAYMLLARYDFGPGTVYAGWEHVQFDNPENPLTAPTAAVGGYILGTVANTAFTENKKLNMYWAGAKYSLTPQLTITGAWYHETQNSFEKVGSCSNTSSADCSGMEDAFSLVADYQLTRRFDVYAGAMYSMVQGGLESGFLTSNTVDPTVGARFRF